MHTAKRYSNSRGVDSPCLADADAQQAALLARYASAPACVPTSLARGGRAHGTGGAARYVSWFALCAACAIPNTADLNCRVSFFVNTFVGHNAYATRLGYDATFT
jgi:hypothetical protein